MSQPVNAMRIVPCECGSHEPYWHGPEYGLREYCCDQCWAARAPDRVRLAIVLPPHCNGCDYEYDGPCPKPCPHGER